MSNFNPAGGGLQYRGTNAVQPPNCTFDNRSPTPYDTQGFSLLDLWLNTVTGQVFCLVSLAGTSSSRRSLADWALIGSSGGDLASLSGNDGILITPSASGNISVVGTGSVTTSKTAPFTLSIAVAVATTVSQGTVQLSTDADTIAGTDEDTVVTPASLKAKLGAQTVDGVPYGTGTTGAFGWTAAGTDGQLIIAGTGLPPAFATLTSTGGTIAITPGPNTLNIDVDDAAEYTVQTTDATPTTLASIAVTTSQSLTIAGEIIGAKSDYSAAIGGNFLGTARRAGGGLTLVGAPIINLNEDSGGSPDFNVVVSGNNLIVQVTGEAATTYNWKATLRKVIV
jgi:hypothetical protein